MTTSQTIATASVSLLLIITAWALAKVYKTRLIDEPMTPFVIVKGNRWFVYNYKKHLTRRVSDGSYFERLSKLADKWNTCPCGNLPQCIRRNVEGIPLDAELAMYGADFSMKARLILHMKYGELASAQEELILLLRKIELRGKVLARQEIANQQQLHVIRLTQKA